jgi:flagellar hook assembly protein FlgD
VTLKIYNMLGQEVRTLINARQEAGYKQVVWDGMNNFGAPVASGVYIYQIQAGSFVQAHKMILMK